MKKVEKFDYLIVGGGIAGTTAAETIRENDAIGSIAIVSDEPHPFYSRIMLSKPDFFLAKIPFENIFLKNEEWYQEKNIKFLGGKKITSLETDKKAAFLDDGNSLTYNKLLLALGCANRQLQIPGNENIFYFKILDEAKKIIAGLKKAKSVVIIGSGFTAFEVSDLMRLSGLETSVVIRGKCFFENYLNESEGRFIEQAMESAGIKIIRNAEVQEIKKNGFQNIVLLKDGAEIPADIVIGAIGLDCDFKWFKSSGIKTQNGILTNEYLETNIPDIYAAGDCAEFDDLILGEKKQFFNWFNAGEQGRIAGANMAGKKTAFQCVSFSISQAFGVNIVFVGDCRLGENREIIKTAPLSPDSIGHLIVKNKRIIGGVVINENQKIASIRELIEKRQL